MRRREEANESGSSDFVPQKNLPEEGQDFVETGAIYKEKNGDREVVPFYVDFANALVRFAPLGRSSEDQMRSSDFLNTYEKMEKSVLAEASPEESQTKAEARIEKAETVDELGRKVERPNQG